MGIRRVSVRVAWILAVMGVGSHVALACANGILIKDVGTQFHATAMDRGQPAIGLDLVLRRGDDDCHGGEVLAQAKTDSRGRAEFRTTSAGPATMCTVDRNGTEHTYLGLNIRAELPPRANVDVWAPGWNPIAVRSASGVIRVADFGPGVDLPPDFEAKLLDANSLKTLYETRVNAKGEFAFAETIPPGRYYLYFKAKSRLFLEGSASIEVKADGPFANVNLDASFSDCGMNSIQRETLGPTKVALACGQVFGSEGKPVASNPVALIDEGGKEVERVSTNMTGGFQFTYKKAGRYVVYAPRFPGLPGRREIELDPAAGADTCTDPLRLDLEFGYQD